MKGKHFYYVVIKADRYLNNTNEYYVTAPNIYQAEQKALKAHKQKEKKEGREGYRARCVRIDYMGLVY